MHMTVLEFNSQVKCFMLFLKSKSAQLLVVVQWLYQDWVLLFGL